MKAGYYGVALALTAIATAAGLYFTPELKAPVPIHWGLDGKPDGFAPEWALMLVGPGGMLATIGIFAAIPWLSPRRFTVDTFMRTYLKLMLVVVTMMGYIFAISLWTGIHGPLGTDRFMAAGLGLLLVMMGNFMGKVHRNFFVGIRTPWTLASERVWHATHRFAGKVWVAGGLLALATALLGVSAWVTMAVALGVIPLPIAYSLVFYKRLERSGELNGAA